MPSSKLPRHRPTLKCKLPVSKLESTTFTGPYPSAFLYYSTSSFSPKLVLFTLQSQSYFHTSRACAPPRLTFIRCVCHFGFKINIHQSIAVFYIETSPFPPPQSFPLQPFQTQSFLHRLSGPSCGYSSVHGMLVQLPLPSALIFPGGCPIRYHMPV